MNYTFYLSVKKEVGLSHKFVLSHQSHFLSLNVNSMSIYLVQAVGRKVRIRELMAIVSADENDDHVIPIRIYKNLQEAIKKVVNTEIGTYVN